MRFSTTRRPLSPMPLPDTFLDTVEASGPGPSMNQARDVDEEYVLVAATDTTTNLEQQITELTKVRCGPMAGFLC